MLELVDHGRAGGTVRSFDGSLVFAKLFFRKLEVSWALGDLESGLPTPFPPPCPTPPFRALCFRVVSTPAGPFQK